MATDSRGRATGDLPSWGPKLKARLEAFPRSMLCAGHSASLPLETNTVSLDPNLKDAWGIPAIRVTYKDHPDDLPAARFLQGRAVQNDGTLDSEIAYFDVGLNLKIDGVGT